MKRALIALCAVAAIAVLAGFALQPPRLRTYTKNETNIVAKEGSTFSIRLEENPTTGYRWQFTVADEALVMLKDDRYVADDAGGNRLGSGGMRILTFEARQSGNTSIAFVYRPVYPSDLSPQPLIFAVVVH